MLEGDEAVNKELTALGAKPEGFYNGWYKDGKIYLNSARFTDTTPLHEAIHPIINVLRQTARAKYDQWTQEASQRTIPVLNADGTTREITYAEFVKEGGYEGALAPDEALVTFLEDFIGDRIDYSRVSEKSVADTIKQLIADFFNYFGIDFNMNYILKEKLK
jgi:hypothetical protein